MKHKTEFLPFKDAAPRKNATARAHLIAKVKRLINMHKAGALGGEMMPEDANPKLTEASCENYLYFTLPMALNYQRNSYTLWQSALKTYTDPETRFVFYPEAVCNADVSAVRKALLKHKLALQPIKHTDTWVRLCKIFLNEFSGDVRHLIKRGDFSVKRIKEIVQIELKSEFPYLSGRKICNYWLYVLEQYTDVKFSDRQHLSVAPDTHVVQASFRLGILDPSHGEVSNVQDVVSDSWRELLDKTDIVPIDVHTPLWLWSRNGFPDLSWPDSDSTKYNQF